MTLFNSFYTGVSGFKASQTGVNTTAHNLANVNTEGYVRQQISYAENDYSTVGRNQLGRWQVGLGVSASETRHIRDLLLDRAYREQASRENYYSSQYEAVEEIENIFGELNGVAFQNSMKNLWDAFQEVSKFPTGTASRAELVMYANEFVMRVEAISDELVSYQKNINDRVGGAVDEINQLADTIYELNKIIQGVEAVGVESANDYRDLRDNALDKLSQLIKIDYTEDEHGMVTVRAEGQEFISYGGVFHMDVITKTDRTGSGYLVPAWPQIGYADVFNLEADIATDKGNDLGKLKGLLMSRGATEANYTFVPVMPEAPSEDDFIAADGSFDRAAFEAARQEYWQNEYADYEKEAYNYNHTTGASVVTKAQALFDKLVNKLVTMVNDIFCPNKDTKIAAGTKLNIAAGTSYNVLPDALKEQVKSQGLLSAGKLDDNACFISDISITMTETVEVSALDTETAGRNKEGGVGEELFSRADTQGRYTELKDDEGNVLFYVFNEYNEFGTPSLYSMRNLEINKNVLDDTSRLGVWDKEGNSNYDIIDRIITKWDDAVINLDPNNLTEKDTSDYYTTMMDLFANDGYVLKEISTNQSHVVDTIQNSRESITGVSSEEELTNLIKFQNAYNANSRFINVISELIDTVVNRMGVR